MQPPVSNAGDADSPRPGAHKGAHYDAKKLAHAPDSSPTEPELAAVVTAWASLPAAVRAGIVAMVAATGGARPS